MQFCTGRKIHLWNFTVQDYKHSVWKQASATFYPRSRFSQARMSAWSYAMCVLPSKGRFRACTCLSPYPAGAEEGLQRQRWRWPQLFPRIFLLRFCCPASEHQNTEYWKKKNIHPNLAVLSGVNAPWNSCERLFWIAKPCGFSVWILEMGGCFQWEQSSQQSCCWHVFSLPGLWILFLLIYYDLCGS